jgi:glycosyltransferase involved in cell wall biosynthesis
MHALTTNVAPHESLVSVVMPAYNAASTIEESIRSVQRQTAPDWTLLVVDDGSTDRTREIVSRLAAKDHRIRLIERDHQGLCAALNAGLEAAETDVFARLDSDDLWAPEHLERQRAFWAENPDAPVLGTWGTRINAKSERLSRMIVGPSSIAEYDDQMSRGIPIFLIHSSVLGSRKVVLDHDGYRHNEYPAEDIHLWNRIAMSRPVLALAEDLTSYRISGTGISDRNFMRQSLQAERLKHRLKTGQDMTFDQFRSYLRHHPVKYFGFQAVTYQRYCFRKGAAYACNGARLRGSLYVAMSAFLNPSLVFRRITSRV